MRFFTPERFIRFNSPHDDEADCADEEWETALTEYRRHLKEIWARIPEEGKKLSELCLHDAELLNPQKAIDPILQIRFEPFGPTAFSVTPALLPLKQEDQLVTLIYLLSGAVRTHALARRWPFSKARPHWLYDEIDLASGQCGPFVHRVLISDGRVLEIPFVSVSVHYTPLSVPGEAKQSRTA